MGGGSIAFYLGIESTGSVVIPVVIASTSPLVTSIAARFVDKEKLTVIQRFGAVIIVLGIIGLNFVSIN